MSAERPSLTYEHLQELYSNPEAFAHAHHYERISLLDELNIPSDWVVEGCLGPEFWEKIKIVAIPLMPKTCIDKEGGAFSHLEASRKSYGQDALFILFRDEESDFGWTATAVLESDLSKDAETLIKEGLEAKRRKRSDLNDMKRAAFLLTQASLVKREPF